MGSINTKTLDNRSAADVINEGKQVVYEIVKSVYNNQPNSAAQLSKDRGFKLMGNRFFTLSTVVRVNQIETSRDESDDTDASSVHGHLRSTKSSKNGQVLPNPYSRHPVDVFSHNTFQQ